MHTTSRLLFLFIFFGACTETPPKKLPYIGWHDVVNKDTVYHTIPDFQLSNQEGTIINNDSLSKYIYVSDFFYTYCPSICPKVKTQLLRVYDKYEQEERLKFVSFALDPKRDHVEHLHSYAKNLGVHNNKWHFLTGDKDEIWSLAKHYLIAVQEDANEPGGIAHSGKIILIDTEGHIRGFAEGTDPDEVVVFMEQIDWLLEEINN